ncbi:hypothetical protein AB5N19_10743 [Seiridium cardinale]
MALVKELINPASLFGQSATRDSNVELGEATNHLSGPGSSPLSDETPPALYLDAIHRLGDDNPSPSYL